MSQPTRDIIIAQARQALADYQALRRQPRTALTDVQFYANQAGALSHLLGALLAEMGDAPTPSYLDRRTPDGCVVGDPVPADLDPDLYPMHQCLPTWHQCRTNSPSSAAGWNRCDRPARHDGQHVTIGTQRGDGTGPPVVTATWPADTGWVSA